MLCASLSPMAKPMHEVRLLVRTGRVVSSSSYFISALRTKARARLAVLARAPLTLVATAWLTDG